MHGFNEEYSSLLKMPINEVFADFKIIYTGGKVVEILNYVKIMKYTKEILVLKVRNNEVAIEGKNLQIKEMCKKDIIVIGLISKVYLLREVRNDEKF